MRFCSVCWNIARCQRTSLSISSSPSCHLRSTCGQLIDGSSNRRSICAACLSTICNRSRSTPSSKTSSSLVHLARRRSLTSCKLSWARISQSWLKRAEQPASPVSPYPRSKQESGKRFLTPTQRTPTWRAMPRWPSSTTTVSSTWYVTSLISSLTN